MLTARSAQQLPTSAAALFDAGGTTVLGRASADVSASRERRRRRRLWRIALALGPPTAYLQWRLLSGHPVDLFQLPSIDWTLATPILFFVALITVLVGSQLGTGRSPHVLYRPEQLDVRLCDVVGIDVVKDEVVRSLNLFLAHETFAAEMGGRPRRGLLFEGGPGTGKTHTAKAMAAEAGVPFLFASASSFQSSFYGATARKIRSYFKALRAAAEREGGAIGFIDEFDAIGGTRRGMEMTAAPSLTAPPAPAAAGLVCCGGLAGLPARYLTLGGGAGPVRSGFGTADLAGPVVNELLVQMQSFETPRGPRRALNWLADKVNLLLPEQRQIPKAVTRPANIMLIASTNRADGLDPALLRPGRFDRRLTFEAPTKAGRRALVDHFLARKAHEAELDDPDHRDAIAAVTTGYTPAMIEGLLDEALINSVRRHAGAMSRKDVEQARLSTEVGLGQPVAYTPHEKRLIATHEAGHATIAHLVAPHRRLEVLTIIKRREALGLLAHGDAEDVFTRSRPEMLALMQIAMAGQCAEEIFFGDISTGPGGDLLYATNLAAEMVGTVGMSGSLISYAAVQNSAFSDTNIVGRVLADPAGRAAIEALLQQQKAIAKELLETNAHLVRALRDALVDRSELIGPEIREVLEAAGPARPDRVLDLRDGASSID